MDTIFAFQDDDDDEPADITQEKINEAQKNGSI
jgi:hypothetical protein